MAEKTTTLRGRLELDITGFTSALEESSEKLRTMADGGVDTAKMNNELKKVVDNVNDFNENLVSSIDDMFDKMHAEQTRKIEALQDTYKAMTDMARSELEDLRKESVKANNNYKDAQADLMKERGKLAKASVQKKSDDTEIQLLKLELTERIQNWREEQAIIRERRIKKNKEASEEKTRIKELAKEEDRILKEQQKQLESNLKQRQKMEDAEWKKELAWEKQHLAKLDALRKTEIAEEKRKQEKITANLKAAQERREKIWNSAKSIAKGFSMAIITLNQLKELLGSVFRVMKTGWDYTYGQVIKINAQMENFVTRLKVVTGSLAEAKRTFADVAKFATTVTFTFQESINNATNLMPVLQGGRKELNKWMPVIADIAAAFGLTMEEATSNFVKAYSAGIASADLFRERGITAALGFIPGKSYTAKETREGIMAGWESSVSVFRGASKELAKTWDGIVSMLIDRWTLFVKKIGDSGIFKTLKENLKAVLDSWDTLNKKNEDGFSLLDRLAQNLSRVLEEIFNKFVNFINNVSRAAENSWLLSGFSGLFDSEEMREIRESLDNVKEKRDSLEAGSTFLDGDELEESQGQLKILNKQIDSLQAKLKSLQEQAANPFAVLNKTLEKVNSVVSDRKEKNVAWERTPSENLRRQTAQNAQRRDLLADARNKTYLGVLLEAEKKIEQQRAKAELGSIKALRGEWAAQQKAVAIEADKLKQDLIKKMGAGGFDESKYMPDVNVRVAEYISASNASFIDAQAESIKDSLAKYQSEFDSLNMTSYQKERAQIIKDYNDKIKDLHPNLQKLAEQERDVRLATLNTTKATSDKILALQRENELQQLAYKETEKHTAQMAALENARRQAEQNNDPNAQSNYEHQVKVLAKTTQNELAQALQSANAQLRSLGQTDAQKDMEELNRQFMQLDDAKKQFSELTPLVEELKKALQEVNSQKHPATFAAGWSKATTEIKSKFMSVGDVGYQMANVTSDAMANAFNEGFFTVFEEGLDGLGAAFESFVNSVLKGLVQIYAQQVAMGLMNFDWSRLFSGGTSSASSSTGGGWSTDPWGETIQNGFSMDKFTINTPIQKDFPEISQSSNTTNINSSNTGNIDVRIHNEGSDNMQVSRTSTQQDVSGMVLDIWIDAFARNKKGVKDMLGR